MKVNTCVSNVYVYWIHAKSKYQIVKTRLTANVSVVFRRSGREFAARNWEIVRHLCGLPTTQYVIFELILLEITDKTMNLLSFARDPVMCVFLSRNTVSLFVDQWIDGEFVKNLIFVCSIDFFFTTCLCVATELLFLYLTFMNAHKFMKLERIS